MAEGDTLVNAVIGAAASFVLSGIVPFSPLFGGGIAGYLQGGDRSEGLRVGAISGAIAVVPAILIGLFVFTVVLSVFVGGAAYGAEGFGVFGLFSGVSLVLFGVFFVAYFVALSAVGGWLGNYVKYDTDLLE
jgi:uncharacterized membrane protein (GlpM family)